MDDARRNLRVERIGEIEVVVLGGDARVDHGHADALPGQAELPARQRRADGGAGAFERRERVAIRDHPRDARFVGERLERVVVDVCDLRANRASACGRATPPSRVRIVASGVPRNSTMTRERPDR